MNDASIYIKGFGLAGYRSFRTLQLFERFSQVNLLIGPNNCGKSNVLKFIHEIYPRLSQQQPLELDPLDRHFPERIEFSAGLNVSLEIDQSRSYSAFLQSVLPKFLGETGKSQSPGYALRVFRRKAELDSTKDVWFEFSQDKKLVRRNWEEAFSVLSDGEMQNLWRALTDQGGGSRQQHWFPESLAKLVPGWRPIAVELVPAIRRIGAKGTKSKEFGGEGIIERLVRLQNPSPLKQDDRKRFEGINQFLKKVTDNASATIEIPHEKDTITVHMNGRALPIASLGTGIHEVVILAAAATVLENTVICMEEPELHLNPILQKKLVRYLMDSTNNQYFITTHSASLMDTPGAEVYRVRLENGQSIVERVTSDKHRSAVCEDLGFHPSDLLQANCIIWVEGPSDRIYIKHWIAKHAPLLQEGIHYSIMFYGGRLAAHLSGNDIDTAIGDFISLRRLNRRAVIVIDSDRPKKNAPLNATKERLVNEFNGGPGYAWITEGREIENYLPAEQIKAAVEAISPTAISTSKYGRYDHMLSIKTAHDKVKQVSKVAVAKHIIDRLDFDDSRLDLRKQLDSLVRFIRESNPTL